MKYPFLIGLVASLPLLAYSQNTPSSGEKTALDTQSYTQEDFSQFAPRTALDSPPDMLVEAAAADVGIPAQKQPAGRAQL